MPSVANVIAYGFSGKCEADPTGLCVNHVNIPHDPEGWNGLGLHHDPNHQISGHGFIQLDLFDLIRLRNLSCKDPNMTIGSVGKGTEYAIYGSNVLGQLGIVLPFAQQDQAMNPGKGSDWNKKQTFIIPSFSSEAVDVGNIVSGVEPFRYISVKAHIGSVTLVSIKFCFETFQPDCPPVCSPPACAANPTNSIIPDRNSIPVVSQFGATDSTSNFRNRLRQLNPSYLFNK